MSDIENDKKALEFIAQELFNQSFVYLNLTKQMEVVSELEYGYSLGWRSSMRVKK